jgi:hypothetical protein
MFLAARSPSYFCGHGLSPDRKQLLVAHEVRPELSMKRDSPYDEQSLTILEETDPRVRADEIVFALYSPYGILPSATNLRRPERFVVDFAGQAGVAREKTGIFPLEVNHDG